MLQLGYSGMSKFKSGQYSIIDVCYRSFPCHPSEFKKFSFFVKSRHFVVLFEGPSIGQSVLGDAIGWGFRHLSLS